MRALCQTSAARLLAAGSLALVAGLAQAKLPAVVDRIPEDSGIFLTIADLQDTLGDLAKFNANYGESLPPDLQQGFAGIGFISLLISQPGVDADGSAAVILYPPEDDADEMDEDWADGPAGEQPDFVALVPITDFKAFAEGPFIASQSPKVKGDRMTLAFDGAEIHMRNLDGFVVLGMNEERVTGFNAGEGRYDAHATKLGHNAHLLSASNDVVLFADVEMMQDGVREGVAGLEQQANFAAMMGGGEQVMGLFSLIKQAADGFLRDGNAGMLGLNVEDAGVAIDLGASFEEGSEIAGFFNNKSDASELLEHVPQGDFLFAYAVDSSGDGLKKLLHNLTGDEAGMGFSDLLANSTGVGGVVGAVPAMGAGLLANSVNYVRSDDPAASMKKLQEVFESAKDRAEDAGISATFTESVTVDGVNEPVTSYSWTMQGNAAGAGQMMMDPAMAMAMLYGGSGAPSGYIAELDDGFVMTSTKNSDALRRAISATKDGKHLRDHAGVNAVAQRMLPERAAEAYVSIDQIMKTVGQFAMMFGMDVPALPEEAMNPVGLSMSASNNGTALRMYLPGDVITYLARLSEAAEADFGGGDGMDDGPRF